MAKVGLRINADKSTFGINEVEYLGYVVTTEGIKPDPKKIQAITDLGRPRTTTEVCKLHCQRYYPMPRIHKDTFRKELARLVNLGVLVEVLDNEWGSPTFIIAKKQGTVRLVSDFRRLNAKIKWKPYPIPRIGDTLQQLEGF